MPDRNCFFEDVLEIDPNKDSRLLIAGFPASADERHDGGVELAVPLQTFSISRQGRIAPLRDETSGSSATNAHTASARGKRGGSSPSGGSDEADEGRHVSLAIRAYGPHILRITSSHRSATAAPESAMLAFDDSVVQTRLTIERTPHDRLGSDAIWIRDSDGTPRIIFRTEVPQTDRWSDLLPPADRLLDALVPLPSSTQAPMGDALHIDGYDQFFPAWRQSVGFGLVEVDGTIAKSAIGFHAAPDEHFSGSGERFAPLDLSGQTLRLVNEDALGVNSMRAYKNVPFFLSSRGYGVFLHTSYAVTASIKGCSTRSFSLAADSDCIDLFVITAGTPEGVLAEYRSLTGFPPELPAWSYGTWMSRMTYFSADEIEEITARLRSEAYPCDVIHIDTGWFDKDWVCEWRFSDERFPDPKAFMSRLAENGFRVSLWQNPNLSGENRLLPEALERGFVPKPPRYVDASASDFAAASTSGQIDFTNPEAVEWYQGLLSDLFEKGASVIKTDFGEELRSDVSYHAMEPAELRNLYGLLYQRAAFEATERATGEPIIWARAGWAGCQRYPLHWGGDAAATWDGLAASLRGGLHLGLSGFGYWSHDVPGFHGIPDFMNTRPDPLLYLRWTQFGVLSSHLRYHGTFAREPWYYPEVSDLVREWLELRYALIPYLIQSAKALHTTGFPVLRALVFHHPDDCRCWDIDDEYYLGDDMLVAPVMNPESVRDVYLPAGAWRNLFSGEMHRGPVLLSDVTSPRERIPVFLRSGARIPVYPERVACVDEMELDRSIAIEVDDDFSGIGNTPLGKYIEL